MFTLPLTAAEYRALVDAKYSPNADTRRGWALRDQQGRTQGWHPRVSGDPHWTNADAALHAFIATAKERRNRALLGWHVVPTECARPRLPAQRDARRTEHHPGVRR